MTKEEAFLKWFEMIETWKSHAIAATHEKTPKNRSIYLKIYTIYAIFNFFHKQFR